MLSGTISKESRGAKAAAARTCAGCRAAEPREELVRLVHVPGHSPCLVPEAGTRLPGHGVWVHPRNDCLRRATRGGFSRALKQAVEVDAQQLGSILCTLLKRRLQGLLVASLRRRQAALGTDAVLIAIAAGAARLLLVAKDAAGRRKDLCARAEDQGVPVLELADKAELGRLTGKETLGFIAVLDDRIAREIADTARALAGLSEDG